jgi:serine/threonine-protein kinase
MASVFRVHDRELDREIALKVLDDQLSDSVESRMVREARVIARLEHPGIVPVHDAGVLADGRPYYAMKLVRGKRLDEQAGTATPLPEILRTFEKICQAVAFAHAHGVIHRDLKPQNIMVGPFGEVLVMDWGIAKVLGAVHPPPAPVANPAVPPPATGTVHGTIAGTPGYMAPEQVRGDVQLLDARTDIYALGAILYFLLTGREPPPVSAHGPAEPNPSPRRHNRLVPRPLAAVCKKAVAFDPGRRYENVSQLAEDIGRFLAERRVQAYPEGPFGAIRRLAVKYRAAVVLVLAYLAMRLLLLLWVRT